MRSAIVDRYFACWNETEPEARGYESMFVTEHTGIDARELDTIRYRLDHHQRLVDRFANP